MGVRAMMSASQIERIKHCPASAGLPQVRETTAAATRGTAVHKFLQDVAAADRDTALENVPAEHLALCESIDLDRLPVELAPEVALAYNVETGTGRELGRSIDRHYIGLDDAEIPGTADVVGVDAGVVFVGDWKTGWSEVPRAADNLQLRLLALAAARTYGCESAIVEVIRIRDNGASWRDRAELDVFDLDSFALELRQLVIEVMAAQQAIESQRWPAVHEGPWCEWCPAFNACPAKTTMLQRLADGSATNELDLMLPLTPEMASIAYERWQTAKHLLRRIERALHDFARKTPIPLADGRWFGEVVKPGNERLDGDVAWAVVGELYGRDVADQAVNRQASKKGIREALRGHLPQGKPLSRAEREVLAQIRERGGAARQERTVVEEYERASESK